MKFKPLDYFYDDLSGLVIEVRCNGESVWKAGDAGFTTRNQVKAITLGNVVTSQFDYELKTGLMRGFITKRGTIVLLEQRLSYDMANNVRQRTINLSFLMKTASRRR